MPYDEYTGYEAVGHKYARAGGFGPHGDARGFVPANVFYTALINRGFAPNAARGWLGNAMVESGGAGKGGVYLDPHYDPYHPEGHHAIGAMQWEGNRKQGVETTLESQINKIWEESHNPRLAGISDPHFFDRVQSASSAAQAASLINRLYERPENPGASEAMRIKYAMGSLDGNAAGAPTFSASSPASVGGSSTTPSEAAQQQSQAYAALMGALANPPQTQRRPGILGRLLFGQQGFEGMLDKALPKNGILGAMFEGLGGAFAPSQANAAPAMAPQPQQPQQQDAGAPMFADGDIPTPPTRPVEFGGQNTPLPPQKPTQFGGKGTLTQPDNDAGGGGAINLAGLDPLRDLFGMMG